MEAYWHFMIQKLASLNLVTRRKGRTRGTVVNIYGAVVFDSWIEPFPKLRILLWRLENWVGVSVESVRRGSLRPLSGTVQLLRRIKLLRIVSEVVRTLLSYQLFEARS